MFVTEFLEQCEAEVLKSFAEKENIYGTNTIRAFFASKWGLADKNCPLGGIAAALKMAQEVEPEELDKSMDDLNNLAEYCEDEFGQGFTMDVLISKYGLRIGNPNYKSGGSFDGTDKGAHQGSSGIMYHLENMAVPYSQELRKEILDFASPEALAYFPDNLDYDPMLVMDASKLSEKMWHKMRVYSIGASAMAAISGTSPFQNKLSLWHEKLEHTVMVGDSDEEIARKERVFAWGHLAEEYLRMMVLQREEFDGCEIFIEPMIFSMDDHQCITCNLDGIIKFPDGHYSVLEFKAPGPYTKDHYENNNIPTYYEEQMQTQMAAVNLDDGYLVALFDRDTITVSHTVRDLDAQMLLFKMSEDFWFTNVLGQQEPEINGPGEITKGTLRKYGGKGNNKAPAMSLDAATYSDILAKAEEIDAKRAEMDKQSRQLKKDYEDVIAPVLAQLGCVTSAECEDLTNKVRYSITYKEVEDSPKLKKKEMTSMQKNDPTLFQKLTPYITYSGGGRRLALKSTKIL